MLTRIALLASALVLIAAMVTVSLRRVGPQLAQRSLAHRVEHVMAFALLAIVLFSLARHPAQKWIVALAILFLAFWLEMRQHQIFRVPFEWWDVRDDSIGLLLAWLFLRYSPRFGRNPLPAQRTSLGLGGCKSRTATDDAGQ